MMLRSLSGPTVALRPGEDHREHADQHREDAAPHQDHPYALDHELRSSNGANGHHGHQEEANHSRDRSRGKVTPLPLNSLLVDLEARTTLI
ncbi:hypothetical protein [Micromonospora sp. WMMD714]|uniref:hypothetical protein n=1 Tax=Micromonospora sp. WMMD714 TaxID=3016097 RepID=UPI002499D8DE|nr:hypothetical protein [Micromonospora sp. WMMD714]WFE62772.1 hypothetical protein O7625_05470 [Micromonospora sp. WMMD714]